MKMEDSSSEPLLEHSKEEDQGRFRKKNFVSTFLLAYLISVVVWGIAAVYLWDKYTTTIGKLSALAGFLAIECLLILSLSGTRTKGLEKRFGLDHLWTYHRWVASVFVILVCIHVGFKVWDYENRYVLPWQTIFDFCFALTKAGGDSYAIAGKVAIYGFLVLIVFAYLRKKPQGRGFLPFVVWYNTHFLTWAGMGLSFYHSYKNAQLYWPVFGLWALLLLATICKLVRRIINVFKLVYRKRFIIKAVHRLGNSRMIRVELSPKGRDRLPRRWRDRHPGQFVVTYRPGFGAARLLSFFTSPPHPFSVTSHPADESSIELTVVVHPKGKMSDRILGFNVGSELLVDGPFGTMPLHGYKEGLVIMAGGAGISPFMSFFRQQSGLPHELRSRVLLLWGVRNAGQLARTNELQEILHRCKEKMRMVLVFSGTDEEEMSEGGRVAEFSVARGSVDIDYGFMDEKFISRWVTSEWQQSQFFVIGPPPMTHLVQRLLHKNAKVPWKRIHHVNNTI